VSPDLRTAMVLSEDKRFYEHSCVDWRAARYEGFLQGTEQSEFAIDATAKIHRMIR
jgi:membrane peptidoglycan carboxypeptidase